MIAQIFFTVIALALVFIFTINKFSRQIERVAGDSFKKLLQRLTNHPVMGVVTGTFITSLFQSSTATTVMTVGLVNAGILTFYQSLGVIFGANIGTTITSQLIALNVVAVAPFIVILGFVLLKFGGKYNIYGKSVFYFGLVFLCISLITQVVVPLTGNADVLNLLARTTSLPVAIFAGILLTVLFQSSAVTNGLILVLATSGLIDVSQGVGIMLGANVGTTSTALLAALPMGTEAKKAALAHLLFNILGLVFVLPVLEPLTNFAVYLGGTVTQQVANMHLFFNLFATIIFVLGIKWFSKLIEWLSNHKFFHIHIEHWTTRA